MKRTFSKFSALLCVCLLLCICLAAFLLYTVFDSSRAANALAGEKASVIYMSQDDEGNILGPTDYTYDAKNDTASVLNTASNAIFTYHGTTLQSCVDLDDFDIIGIKIACSSGSVYILGNDFTLYKIQTDGTLCELYNASEALKTGLGLGSAPDLATVTDVTIIEDSIYLRASETDGSVTYVLPTEAAELSENTVQIAHGSLAEDGVFYTTTLQPEGDYHCGHTCVIDLKRADGTQVDTITLTSENLIDGARYLYTDDDGNYIIKEYTLCESGDQGEELLLSIGKDHEIKSSRSITDS